MNVGINTDVLIIGSGIAGCIPALLLAEKGYDVTLVTKTSSLRESNTYYAQGGIIYKGKNDTPDLLTEDIIGAGAGLSYKKATRILAEEGPRLVEDLLIKKYNVPFSREPGGKLKLSLEGSHSVPRVIHAEDATGKAIVDILVGELKKHTGIRILHNCTAIDLLTPSHHSKNRLKIGRAHV